MELSKEEKSRYSRQIVLPDFGVEGQEKLKNASVLVVGAGGLGCPCLLYLATSGVGTISIIDDDVVSLSNLQRQTLFDEADLGMPKCEAAAHKLRMKNDSLRIFSFNERLSQLNAIEHIKAYDVVIDGTDNFETGYLLNDACVLLGKPLVYASIFQYEGQLSVFNHHGGPTLRCLFPEVPSDMDTCSISGVFSPLAGLLGVWQASEALKIITEKGETLSGKFLVFNILANTSTVLSFNENPENKNPDFLKSNLALKTLDITAVEPKIFYEQQTKYELLIDVRDEEEFEAFNIGGENIPISNLNSRIDTIDTKKKILVVCQSGIRSLAALKLIKTAHPNANIQHLKGGINAYNAFVKNPLNRS